MALPDLDLTNVFNIVEKNFKKLGLKAYAVRIVYAGEHTLSKDELKKHFKKTVQAVNSGYCEIHIHGFLLVYDSHFVHILEGSEDTVHRQLRFLFKLEEDWIKRMTEQEEKENTGDDQPRKEWKMFKRLKMLMVYHSISTLIFDSWRAVTGRPPSLIANLNVYGPLPEHMEQLRICMDKITKLCNLAKVDDNLFFEGLPPTDPRIEALPEVALLDFLLQSPHVMDLRHVVHLHRRVDDYVFYFEQVWPLPTHYNPRLLYKLKVDDSFVEPLPVMPWEIEKQKEKDKEGDEGEESSSDSD